MRRFEEFFNRVKVAYRDKTLGQHLPDLIKEAQMMGIEYHTINLMILSLQNAERDAQKVWGTEGWVADVEARPPKVPPPLVKPQPPIKHENQPNRFVMGASIAVAFLFLLQMLFFHGSSFDALDAFVAFLLASLALVLFMLGKN
jgi:hypothetical protein